MRPPHIVAVILAVFLLFIPIIITDGSDADTVGISLVGVDGQPFTGPILENGKVHLDTENIGGVTYYKLGSGTILSDGIAAIRSTGDSQYILTMKAEPTDSLSLSYVKETGLQFTFHTQRDCGDEPVAFIELSYPDYASTDGTDVLESGKDYWIRVSTVREFTFTDPTSFIGAEDIAFTFTASYPQVRTVTFDPNGGTVSMESMPVTEGGRYGDLPIPSRYGYSFDGWYTSPVGGSMITSDTIVTMTDDHTLYAHWSYVSEPTPDIPGTIGPDGNRTEVESDTIVDGDRTTVIQKETVTKTDGSKVVTESTTVTERTEMGSNGTSTSITVNRDPAGNIVSITETTVTKVVDGGKTVTDTDSVTRDPAGNIISEQRTESVDNDLGGGRTGSTSVSVKGTSDGKVTTEASSEITNRYGSTERVDNIVETHTDLDGNIIRIVETGSKVTETRVSNGIVTKVDSTVTTKDADGNILRTDTIAGEDTLRVSGNRTTTSSTSTTESRDAEGNLLGITESFSETTQSPGSDIVTEFRDVLTYPTGETKVSEGVQRTAGDYSITTVAVVVTEGDIVDADAETTLNYLGEAILDTVDVDRAHAHSLKTTRYMPQQDISRHVKVNTGFGVSAKATSGAMDRMSELGMGLCIEGYIGSLKYDAEACRGFSDLDTEMVFDLVRDVSDVLTEAQKVVIGPNTFVSVSAYAGAEYVTGLGGTVTITFDFNPGLPEYVAFYVADDGSIEEVPFDYDRSTGKVSMRSTHHSVYAMLPVEEPLEDTFAPGHLLLILIVVIIAALAAIIVWRSRA